MKKPTNNVLFSCVLDYSPLMSVQTYIWLTNLLQIGIEPKSIYIHLVSDIPLEFKNYLSSIGVCVIEKKPFDHRNKYCNKLVQLETFNELKDYDYVFLMDCDTAILDLDGLELKASIYAKIVDFPNPPLSILQHLFKVHNFKLEEAKTTFPIKNNQLTDWNNCNGGVYIVSRDFLPKLGNAWMKYSIWSIENSNLFEEQYAKHADQVGFALAMASLNENTTHLDVSWNYPTHVKSELNIKPKIIHYHDAINEHLQLKNIGLSEVDKAITIINERISKALSTLLNNTMFWDYRYQSCPDLGSGVGSRGEILEFKKRLIHYLSFGFNNKTIIDVGCGDLELTKTFDFTYYLGLDVSSQALKIAKNKRPDWEFRNLSIEDNDVPNADLILCFDVLIHQSDAVEFENMVKAIVQKANTRIIVGAYNSKTEFSSTITHFHNSILDEIKKYKKFNELAIVAKYRDVSVIVGSINDCSHSRDIGSESLNKAFFQVNRPDLLQYLVDVSRNYLGFYTAHYPRVFEYTWLLEQLEHKKGKTALDIGAGVCPLPICLNALGMSVTTIDSHSKVRDIKHKDDWNEWGYLDYSLIDSRIVSKQIDFANYRTFKKFDYIYSISVIEHMPRVSRLKVFKKASRLLKKGGKLLLTIDIEQKTNKIWNRSEDKEVESDEQHGTIQTFKDELLSFGFNILNEHVLSDISHSRTDVWFVEAVLSKKGFI